MRLGVKKEPAFEAAPVPVTERKEEPAKAPPKTTTKTARKTGSK